jgi:hypothetical protein
VGFKASQLEFDLESGAGAEERDKLIATTEPYCVTFQNLAGGPAMSVSSRPGT